MDIEYYESVADEMENSIGCGTRHGVGRGFLWPIYDKCGEEVNGELSLCFLCKLTRIDAVRMRALIANAKRDAIRLGEAKLELLVGGEES